MATIMEIHHGHAFGAGALIAAIAVGIVVALAPARRIAHEPALPPAARLSDAARAALRTQMHAHARGMMELVSSTTVLDYAGVTASAQRLLAEPRIARPLSDDATELNAALPARFFALQDQLRSNLQSVADAAAARDASRLADAFAATTRTCVHCHDAYLTGR
jgi:hypothetical protein